MSVPLDLSLITQLLTEQSTTGDLNALTKPGFFYVTEPTNTPNDVATFCHVINLFNTIPDHLGVKHNRLFQIYINDDKNDNTIWYRQCSEEWTDWERLVTATDLQNSMSKKVNNSDLVADYYNKTDVDALINTINTQLDTKASYAAMSLMENVAAKIYDNNGTVHSETTDNGYNVLLVGGASVGQIKKTHISFTLQDDYPVNTKFTKIAISTEAFSLLDIIPAAITIEFDGSTKILATLDTDNSDMEFFIYNVPTNLQTVPIGKGKPFDVFF